MRTTRKFPRFRFSLRLMLVLVSVFGVWLGVLETRVRRQRNLVATIEQLGGRVFYDYETLAGEPSAIKANATPHAAPWLRGLVGDDYFRSVKSVFLDGTAVTDADLAILKNARGIELLSLNDTRISAAGLAHLSSLTNLTFLSLSNTPIDDSAIAEVHDMTSLRELRLNGTAITASCLQGLKQNRSLEHLWVSASQITDEDTKDLRSALPRVEIFYDIRGR